MPDFFFIKINMKTGVIGLGLIGGSICKELNREGSGYEVYGSDRSDAHAHKACELQLVREVLSLEDLVDKCQVIALCVPVDKIEELALSVLDRIDERQIVFDVGSTKSTICKAVADHPMRHRFVAAHPLAGTEFSGPEAALLNLFRGKKNIICESGLSDPDAIETVERLFLDMGMPSYHLDAEEHDKHMAFVSHLSHVSSFALSQTVLDIEEDEKQIFNLASTGFASTARLAKCNPDTWTAIFDKNRAYLSQALEAYIVHVQKFKDLLDKEDNDGMYKAIVKANDISRVLQGIQARKLEQKKEELV